MEASPADPLGALKTRTGTRRARVRVGAGAVVVLLLLGLGGAALVTSLTPTGSSTVVHTDGSPRAADDSGDLDTGGDGGAGGSGGVSDGGGTIPPGAVSDESDDVVEDAVFVHVLGAVARPGLYEVTAGARIVDVIAAAGGFGDGADQSQVNLARPVSDGEQLYVPTVGETIPPPPASTGSAGGGAFGDETTPMVNLNTATLAELDTLPRIGPQLAQRILDWRSANGGFTTVEDLLSVPGIGEKTFDGMAERVTV